MRGIQSSLLPYTLKFVLFFTSRARAAHPAGPIVTLRFSVCLSVHLSVHGLGRPGNINGGSWHTWLLQVSWFVRLLAAKESKTMAVLSTVEAQLSLHKHNVAKAAPEALE